MAEAGSGEGADATDPPREPHDDDAGQDRHDVPAVVRALQPGQPPRRTGVFVDVPSLRAHVGDLLRAQLGGYEVDAWGNFTFTHDDARVFVTVGMSPVGPQVGVFSITNVDVDLTPALARFLVTTNHRLALGAFSYDPGSRAVWLRHTLLGATLDAPELHAAVAAVASTAADADDRIRERFGGRTFHDAPDDVQDSARPPETRPGASGYL